MSSETIEYTTSSEAVHYPVVTAKGYSSGDAFADACPHPTLRAEVVDQTLGVTCTRCGTLLHYCWMDAHVPESAWNKACAGDPDSKPCDQNRDDHCAICGVRFVPEETT